MERHHVKLISKYKGEHIRTTIFSGNEGETLANIGTLIQQPGEWTLFCTTLKAGAKQSIIMENIVLVTIEGAKEIEKQLEKEERKRKEV